MMKSRPHPMSARPSLATFLVAAVLAAGVLVGSPRFADGQDDRKPSAMKASPPAPKTGIDVPKIKYTRFVLPNGLTVILHEDHSSPIVATDLFYHVGSKNDTPGKSGLAHLFEHMLDEGSVNLPKGNHGRIIQEAGGSYNATTNEDRTSFYSKVPSNQLETLLWLEAERMAFLAPTLDSARFELEREAVRNEYRQNVSSAPAGGNLGAEAFFGVVFAGTPYGLPLFGHMSELGSSTVADLRAFYAKFYGPNNAVLSVAGDFETADARKKIERYFGGVPRGPLVKQPAALLAPLAGEQRIVLEDRVAPTKQLWIGWRGVKSSSLDRIALTALSGILYTRLQRLLVTDRRIAASMNRGRNAHFDLELSGITQTVVVATGSMTDIERLVDSVVASVRTDGVTPVELKRWVASFATTSLTQLQAVAVKSQKLADGATIQGNPGAVFAEIEVAQKLAPVDVHRVAQKYLVPQRVVMSIVPAGKLDLVSKPAEPYVNVTRPKP